MEPALYPEVLRNIFRHFRADDEGTINDKRERQATLASLMNTSEMFSKLCPPLLYQDCVVSDLVSFLEGMNSTDSDRSSHLTTVETLRLCHPAHADLNPPYQRLMAVDPCHSWDLIGIMDHPESIAPGEHARNLPKAKFEKAAVILSDLIERGTNVLPNLKPVVVQRHGDDQQDNPTEGYENTIGDMLIGLPSVDMYCEASISGPLSISTVLYKPLHPPKIATFHLNDGNHCEWFMVNDLPMIVSATNRYICATPFEVISPGHMPQAGEAII